MSSLRIPIGPGLAFQFDLPARLRRRVERFLGYYAGGDGWRDAAPALPPVRVTSEPPAKEAPTGTTLLEEPPLVVRRAGELTLFELPQIQAWCHTAQGHAGIQLAQPSESELDLFIGLVLAPMLIELAPSRGWLGVHAAGVAIEGTGILLPGPSGAGKSTIFTHVHRAGHQVLSDDLVWLRPTENGSTMYAFPRGACGGPVPDPTAENANLQAIVYPIIASRTENRLLPIAFPQALEILINQSGFLTSGASAGDRFRTLVRVAQSVPAYRLEAGQRRRGAPSVLADLAASTTSHLKP